MGLAAFNRRRALQKLYEKPTVPEQPAKTTNNSTVEEQAVQPPEPVTPAVQLISKKLAPKTKGI